MISILGLSDAGKSTWLGALLDTLEDATGPLRLKVSQKDFKILDGYRQSLLHGAYPEHTKIDDLLPTRFELIWRGEPVDLDVSDYSGERITRLHGRISHAWDQGWQERASSKRLALLLRADKLQRLERRGPRPAPATHFSQDLTPDAEADRPRQPPTALALVEALQAMRAFRGHGLGQRSARGEERLAVVLTAWDKAGDSDPRRFLEDHAPLLAAWLDTNLHPADVEVFGLSATGGDLEDRAHGEYVVKKGLAKVAYCCVGSPACPGYDISLPLQWLLDHP